MPLRGIKSVSHVSSKIPSLLRDSFNALNSSRLAYKEFENCPVRGTKREIAAMRSPVFGFHGNCLIDCEERSPSNLKTEVRFSSFLSSSNAF